MLPQNTVRCIAVDELDNKWVGTDYGLAVFDNAAWTIYNTSNSGLPDNNVRAIAIDGQGSKWIGTLSGGVAKYDGSVWTIYNPGNSPLPSNFVRAITFDDTGAVWLGTSSGLAKFDGSNWQLWNSSNSGLISNHIASIAIGQDGTRYLGTINGGMVYMTDTSMTHYNLWNGTMPDNTILSIALDSAGNRWAGMPSGGVMVHYGGSSWQWFATINSGIQSDAISSIFIDNDDRVYIASQSAGLIVNQGFSFVNYDSTNSPVPDVSVLCVTRDSSGILWLGTMYGGLVRIDEGILNPLEELQQQSAPVLWPSLLRKGDVISFYQRDVKVRIYDEAGRLHVNALCSGSLRLELEQGLYIAEISSPKGISYSKLVITD
jgi:ligand-binding sensor domain-containing protein